MSGTGGTQETGGALRRLVRPLVRPILSRLRGPATPPPDAILAAMEGRLRDQLATAWDWRPDLRVTLAAPGDLAQHDLRLSREGPGYVVQIGPDTLPNAARPPSVGFAATYLLQFRDASEALTMVTTLSDGQRPGTYRFAPSTASPSVVPIVDPFFFRDRGYAEAQAAFAKAPDWNDRDDALVWRGAPNGAGTLTWDAGLVAAGGINPRCRLALLCRGTEIDAGFVFPDGYPLGHLAPFFAAEGLIRPRKPPLSWAGHRYALDIDGNTNAWDNFLVRLKLGCCVLKVDSEQGYRQWYYDRLRPWEHFVPVKSDLSDLFEQYDRLRADPARARAIAAAGRAVASAMTLKVEWAEGTRAIAEHWND